MRAEHTTVNKKKKASLSTPETTRTPNDLHTDTDTEHHPDSDHLNASLPLIVVATTTPNVIIQTLWQYLTTDWAPQSKEEFRDAISRCGLDFMDEWSFD